MKKRRRRFAAKEKARIALEALRGNGTINEIAGRFGVHPNQITTWKKQASEGLGEIFSNGRVRSERQEEQVKAELYQQIGKLKVELEWLKKKSGLFD